jgi:hypothetical protein
MSSSDLQMLQLAATHLTVAMRLLDNNGLKLPAAYVDKALHALRVDIERCSGNRPRFLGEDVDFTLLDNFAVEWISQANGHAGEQGAKRVRNRF